MTITVKVDHSNLEAKIKRQTDALQKLPVESLVQFRALTPKRSGNARSQTNLSSNNKSINALYPYAQKLDDGYSRQRPNGMTKPFAVWFKEQVKKIARIS